LRHSANQAKAAKERPVDAAAQYESVMRVAERTDNERDRAIAIGLYQRAHEIDPSQPEPLLRLLEFYHEMGHEDQVAEAYRRLTEIAPTEPDYHLEYGFHLLRADKLYEARDEFLQAVALEQSVRGYNAAGVTYDMVGDRRSAQGFYRRALNLDADYMPARGNLGLSLALSGDHEAAITLLEETAAMPDAGPNHRRMLATAYGLSGDMTAASRVAGKQFDEQALAANLKLYGAAE